MLNYGVDSGHPNLSASDGILYRDTGAELVISPAGRSGSFTVMEGVTTIGDDAFHSVASQLTSVSLPSGLLSIGERAFQDCDLISELVFPESFEYLSDSVFQGCDGLMSVQFEGESLELGQKVFSGCSLLESVSLPDGVLSLPYAAFSHCGSLISFTLPVELKVIGEAVFSECKSLSQLNFNESLEEIGDEAFFGCESLTAVVLPGGLLTIADYAFAECTGLELVSVAKSVTDLGEWSFEGSSQIETFILKGDAPISGLSLIGLDALTNVYYSKAAQGFGVGSTPAIVDVDLSVYPAAWWLLERKHAYNLDLSIDFSGDGVSLLEAYALGLDPNVDLSSSTPVVKNDSGRFIYEYSADTESVLYDLQVSDDMASWSGVSPFDIETSSAGTLVYELDPRSSPKKFIRLELLVDHSVN